MKYEFPKMHTSLAVENLLIQGSSVAPPSALDEKPSWAVIETDAPTARESQPRYHRTATTVLRVDTVRVVREKLDFYTAHKTALEHAKEFPKSSVAVVMLNSSDNKTTGVYDA